MLQLKTVASVIFGSMINLTLPLGNLISEIKNMYFFTRNRLRCERSNDGSNVSAMKVAGNLKKVIKKCYNSVRIVITSGFC